MTSSLSEEQIKEIRDSFNSIDKNGDGRISVTELMRAQQALGLNPTRKEVQQMIKEVDKDKSGFIEFKEYVELMAERVGALQYEEDMMKSAFQTLDKDGSGKLSREELKVFLTTQGDALSEAEFDDVINGIDLDGDGQIDVNEFCTMLCQKQES